MILVGVMIEISESLSRKRKKRRWTSLSSYSSHPWTTWRSTRTTTRSTSWRWWSARAATSSMWWMSSCRRKFPAASGSSFAVSLVVRCSSSLYSRRSSSAGCRSVWPSLFLSFRSRSATLSPSFQSVILHLISTLENRPRTEQISARPEWRLRAPFWHHVVAAAPPPIIASPVGAQWGAAKHAILLAANGIPSSSTKNAWTGWA